MGPEGLSPRMAEGAGGAKDPGDLVPAEPGLTRVREGGEGQAPCTLDLSSACVYTDGDSWAVFKWQPASKAEAANAEDAHPPDLAGEAESEKPPGLGPAPSAPRTEAQAPVCRALGASPLMATVWWLIFIFYFFPRPWTSLSH